MVELQDCKATIYFPEIFHGVNLINPQAFGYFRFSGLLGIVPDMVWTSAGYKPVNPAMTYHPVMNKTAWIPTGSVYSGGVTEIALAPGTLLDESGSLLLSVGIEFGNNAAGEEVVGRKVVGAGKILVVG